MKCAGRVECDAPGVSLAHRGSRRRIFALRINLTNGESGWQSYLNPDNRHVAWKPGSPPLIKPQVHNLFRSPNANGACRAALLLALCGALACACSAQTQQPAAARAITQAQADLYERWRSNINANQAAAFDAGREYLAKYGADEYAAYVRPWVDAYERAARKLEFQRLFKAQKYAQVFAAGARVLADEPADLKTTATLAYAGYLANAAGDETHNAEALAHARRAVALIEGGARAPDWQPFADQPDALGYLNFIVGELTFRDDPANSARLYIKALGYASTLGRAPVIYTRLAAAYVASEYDPLSKDYAARFAGREPTAESRAALDRINAVVDRIIDAYARAAALSGSDAKYAAARVRWVEELTRFYKFRHDDSTAGLDALIAAAASKPPPQ